MPVRALARRPGGKPTVIRVGISKLFIEYPEILAGVSVLTQEVRRLSDGEMSVALDPIVSKLNQRESFTHLRDGQVDMVISSAGFTNPSPVCAAFFGMLAQHLSSDQKVQWLSSDRADALWAELNSPSALRSLYFGTGADSYGQFAHPEIWEAENLRGRKVASRCHIRNQWYSQIGFQTVLPRTVGQLARSIKDGDIDLAQPLQHACVQMKDIRSDRLSYFVNDWNQSPNTFELLSRSDWYLKLSHDQRTVLRRASLVAAGHVRSGIVARENRYLDQISQRSSVHHVSAHSPIRRRLDEIHRGWLTQLTRRNDLAKELFDSQMLGLSALSPLLA